MAKESGFQLSGSAPEAYENIWVPAKMGQCAQDLVGCANIKVGNKVLDVACGTGVVARIAAKLVGTDGKVTAMDLNKGMLDVARNFAEKQKITKIEWQQEDATSMSFDDGSFEVVLCQQGLQFIPDRSAAMSEMSRVLVSGGRLALSVWRAPSVFSVAFGKTMDTYFGEGTSAPWQAAFSLSDRDELRSLATNAGLKNAHVSLDVKIARHPNPEEFVLGGIAGTPLSGEVASWEVDQRMELVREILSAMDKYIDDSGVASSAECHTLTAQKWVHENGSNEHYTKVTRLNPKVGFPVSRRSKFLDLLLQTATADAQIFVTCGKNRPNWDVRHRLESILFFISPS